MCKAAWVALVIGLLLIAEGSCAAQTAPSAEDEAPEAARLEIVAVFGDHQPTGVAVSREGRIFVTFPRWGGEHLYSVAEVTADGNSKPFPDAEWNRWSEGIDPRSHFVCVQSAVVDKGDSLWILDAGAPGPGMVVPGAPKVVQVSLSTGRITRVIAFDFEVVPPGAYLNDLVVDPVEGYVFITDSGLGAIILIDLEASVIERFGALGPSVLAEENVVPLVRGKELRSIDGSAPRIHVDGIAVDRNYRYLYYHALSANTLYRVDTRYLTEPDITAADLMARLERVAETGPVDGMVMADDGTLYLTAIGDGAIKALDADGTIRTVVQDDRLEWPDSLAIGPDGYLYCTASAIHLMPRFNGGVDGRRSPYTLFKIKMSSGKEHRGSDA